MKTTPKIAEIHQEELTPLVTALVEIIRIQREQIQELRDEIARLKGQKPKLKIKDLDFLNHLTDVHPQSS
jgi:hypothetical protein